MSTIKAPKSAGPPKEHTLRVGTKTLKLTQYETPDAYTIFIGGHELYCIEAMVYKKDSNYVKLVGFPANVAYLSQIYFNINCSLSHNFQRGLDTNRIFLLMCSYIRNEFSYVDTVSFTDASYRTCDNGQDVELSEMSYLRTGKTWYEKNYNAYMDPSDIPKFKSMETKIGNVKASMPWNLFQQYIRGDLPYSEDELKHMYDSAATWLHSFFNSISGSYRFSSAKFYINIQKLQNIIYQEEDYKRGGQRFTRKRHQRKRNYQ